MCAFSDIYIGIPKFEYPIFCECGLYTLQYSTDRQSYPAIGVQVWK